MKIVVLGAHRGLGFELTQILLKNSNTQLFLSSRQVLKLQSMARSQDVLRPYDFSKVEDQKDLIRELQTWEPERIFYVAGGGPFGLFKDKAWKDHQWALEVSFLFPAQLLHHFLALSSVQDSLKQFILVGSAVAESQPDFKAASYSAAKHALKGLIESVQLEKPDIDVRLFSPNYMNTDMLPANALPRQLEVPIEEPCQVAFKLWEWSQKARADALYISLSCEQKF